MAMLLLPVITVLSVFAVAAVAVNSSDDEKTKGLRFTGSKSMEGFLEIYQNDAWLAICENSVTFEPEIFTTDVVACRQLGFGNAASRNKSSPPGSVSDVGVFVACKGYENQVQDCQTNAANSCPNSVYVTCKEWEQTDVRLTGGNSNLEGVVEVYFEGEWGTVCNRNHWNMNGATVVCRQLGYGTPTSAWASVGFGQGGDALLNGVNCTGLEANIFDCPVLPDSTSCPNYISYARIICSFPEDYDIRLNGGTSFLDGRVEIFLGGSWGQVCDDQWDIADAAVACLQMGLGMAKQVVYVPYGKGDVLFDRLQCTGEENELQECEHRELGDVTCDSQSGAAGVVCTEGTAYTMRLTNGDTYLDGVVEVIVDDQWRTVCYEDWDVNDALVVCAQLGSSSLLYMSAAYYTKLNYGAALTNVFCSGSESGLHECPRLPGNRCPGSRLATVACDGSQNGDEGKLRLVDGNSSNEGRVEIMFQNRWSTISDNGWDIVEANVVCAELGYGSAVKALAGSGRESDNGIVLCDVDCRGTKDETRLIYCRHGPWDYCNYSWENTAGVICVKKESKLTTGQIIGISIGSFCLFFLLMCCVSHACKSSSKSRNTASRSAETRSRRTNPDPVVQYTPQALNLPDELPPPYEAVVSESPFLRHTILEEGAAVQDSEQHETASTALTAPTASTAPILHNQDGAEDGGEAGTPAEPATYEVPTVSPASSSTHSQFHGLETASQEGNNANDDTRQPVVC